MNFDIPKSHRLFVSSKLISSVIAGILIRTPLGIKVSSSLLFFGAGLEFNRFRDAIIIEKFGGDMNDPCVGSEA